MYRFIILSYLKKLFKEHQDLLKRNDENFHKGHAEYKQMIYRLNQHLSNIASFAKKQRNYFYNYYININL